MTENRALSYFLRCSRISIDCFIDYFFYFKLWITRIILFSWHICLDLRLYGENKKKNLQKRGLLFFRKKNCVLFVFRFSKRESRKHILSLFFFSKREKVSSMREEKNYYYYFNCSNFKTPKTAPHIFYFVKLGQPTWTLKSNFNISHLHKMGWNSLINNIQVHFIPLSSYRQMGCVTMWAHLQFRSYTLVNLLRIHSSSTPKFMGEQ